VSAGEHASAVARVIERYRAQYTDPIGFAAGDELVLGRRDDQFVGWMWATAPSGKSGWVPIEALAIEGARGRALCDYTARELDVDVDERVTIESELAGWAWVRSERGGEGWVPLAHLAR
jgi:hypothetical protein